ncbi:hypothetical protein MKEN_00295700 [Mycena kentingensis (nom. inval.)]|nr:hypothetical protein MKEN_00295700 [Mycena kentingensis (nom. inval.)]
MRFDPTDPSGLALSSNLTATLPFLSLALSLGDNEPPHKSATLSPDSPVTLTISLGDVLHSSAHWANLRVLHVTGGAEHHIGTGIGGLSFPALAALAARCPALQTLRCCVDTSDAPTPTLAAPAPPAHPSPHTALNTLDVLHSPLPTHHIDSSAAFLRAAFPLPTCARNRRDEAQALANGDVDVPDLLHHARWKEVARLVCAPNYK